MSSRRPALPTDPAALPGPGERFESTLREGLATIGLTISQGVHAALEAQVRLLLAWNRAINLTALRSPEQIARNHILDSLAALPSLRAYAAAQSLVLADLELIDLGSGAGYPGLPLAVTLPVGHAILVDSIQKKARFLETAAAAAGEAMHASGERPPQITVTARRAEELGHDPQHRETSHVVVVRALGTIRELVELGLPLLRIGGVVMAWKRDGGAGGLDQELAAAQPLLRSLGAEPSPSIIEVTVPGLSEHRLVMFRKVAATPPRYPRSKAERRRDWYSR